MLQHAPPFKIDSQNWFPLLLYKKILLSTSIESIQYGGVSILRNSISFRDIMDTIEIYCNKNDDTEYILDAMILINNIFDNNRIGNLISAAKTLANKQK